MSKFGMAAVLAALNFTYVIAKCVDDFRNKRFAFASWGVLGLIGSLILLWLAFIAVTAAAVD